MIEKFFTKNIEPKVVEDCDGIYDSYVAKNQSIKFSVKMWRSFGEVNMSQEVSSVSFGNECALVLSNHVLTPKILRELADEIEVAWKELEEDTSQDQAELLYHAKSNTFGFYLGAESDQEAIEAAKTRCEKHGEKLRSLKKSKGEWGSEIIYNDLELFEYLSRFHMYFCKAELSNETQDFHIFAPNDDEAIRHANIMCGEKEAILVSIEGRKDQESYVVYDVEKNKPLTVKALIEKLNYTWLSWAVDEYGYFRKDTDDSTTQENEQVYYEIAETLRNLGWDFIDAQIEHDCISGQLKFVGDKAD